jgi:outer membrane protein assembly factor BamD
MMKQLFSILLILLMACSGCTWVEPKGEPTAEELANEGMDNFNNANYLLAMETFEKLKDWYPFSKHSIIAELKIADSHFNLKEYEEAIAAYEDFERLHPRNEATPYVIYQIGYCYFIQIDTIDRDQAPSQKALAAFNRLKKQFPEDIYTQKAVPHIHHCTKSLAGNMLYVGMYYYKSKHYKAALNRFKAVISNFPDVGIHQTALEYIALCESQLKELESATPNH